jgi:hypothetical protein
MAARQEEIFGSSPHWASLMAEDEGWRSVAEPVAEIHSITWRPSNIQSGMWTRGKVVMKCLLDVFDVKMN